MWGSGFICSRVIVPLKYIEYGLGYIVIRSPIYLIFYLLKGHYNPKSRTLISPSLDPIAKVDL